MISLSCRCCIGVIWWFESCHPLKCWDTQFGTNPWVTSRVLPWRVSDEWWDTVRSIRMRCYVETGCARRTFFLTMVNPSLGLTACDLRKLTSVRHVIFEMESSPGFGRVISILENHQMKSENLPIPDQNDQNDQKCRKVNVFL